MNNEEADGMSELHDRARPEEEAGYGAATEGDMRNTPDQEQQTREPASEEEAEQNNYANTEDDHLDMPPGSHRGSTSAVSG